MLEGLTVTRSVRMDADHDWAKSDAEAAMGPRWAWSGPSYLGRMEVRDYRGPRNERKRARRMAMAAAPCGGGTHRPYYVRAVPASNEAAAHAAKLVWAGKRAREALAADIYYGNPRRTRLHVALHESRQALREARDLRLGVNRNYSHDRDWTRHLAELGERFRARLP